MIRTSHLLHFTAFFLVTVLCQDFGALRRKLDGDVIVRGDARFEDSRKVHNKACTEKPLAIVVPRTSQDVAIAVNFARKNGLEISVCSGGHGYICGNLKQDGLHIDLRRLRTIKLVYTDKSSSGIAVILGPGSTWGDVLRKVPPSRYSFVHGQCPSVGVSGYILGGGVNWLGTHNKYGYAAEQTLRMRVITANGSIVDVEPYKSTIHPRYTHEQVTILPHTYNTNLFFALRGAGSSYGIVTEFLYTIYKTPETQPAVFLGWINGPKDFWRIQTAAEASDRFSITINNEFAGDFWNSPKTKIIYKFLPFLLTSLKIIHMSGNTPVFITVTDIRPYAGTNTNPIEAFRYLQEGGVNIVYPHPIMVHLIDKASRYLYDMNVRETEIQEQSEYNLAGVNLVGMEDTMALEHVFFHNPAFGVKRRNNQMFRSIGCNYCFWTIHFRNRQSFPSIEHPISTNTDKNAATGVDSNLACLFRNRRSMCPQEVLRVKKDMEHRLHKYNRKYGKFINWPSCDSEDWMFRYWGDNYYQLLEIKKYWDPDNVFHHCQSVGSSDNSCCPFTFNKPQGPS